MKVWNRLRNSGLLSWLNPPEVDWYTQRMYRFSLLAFVVLAFLAAPPVRFLAAGWLAPLLALRYIAQARLGRGFVLLVVAHLMAWAYPALEQYTQTSQALISLSIQAVLFSLPYLLQRLLRPLFNPLAHSLVFPACYVAVEFLAGRWLPGGVLAPLSLTQLEFTPLAQALAYTGPWSLTFLLTWFAATVHLVFFRQVRSPLLRQQVAVYLLASVALVLVGVGRLNSRPDNSDQRESRFALYEGQDYQAVWKEPSHPQERDWRAAESANLLNAGQLVLPAARWLTPENAVEVLSAWQKVSVQTGVGLVLPFLTRVDQAEAEASNVQMQLVWMSPRPDESRLYASRLWAWLPLELEGRKEPREDEVIKSLENPALDSLPGWRWLFQPQQVEQVRRNRRVLRKERFSTSVLFWDDLARPGYVSSASLADARLLLVWSPPYSQRRPELATLRLSALISGATVVGLAPQGPTAVCNAWGQTLLVSRRAAGTNLLQVNLPEAPGPTLYSLSGDWLAWICVGWVALMLGRALWRRYRVYSRRVSTAKGSVQDSGSE